MSLLPNFTCNALEFANQIDQNTIMIVGSAPDFPYGHYDPILELSKIASEKGVGLHVDACMGGFINPFI